MSIHKHPDFQYGEERKTPKFHLAFGHEHMKKGGKTPDIYSLKVFEIFPCWNFRKVSKVSGGKFP